jgi:hypothetical protein
MNWKVCHIGKQHQPHSRGHRGRICMADGATTTCVINASQH